MKPPVRRDLLRSAEWHILRQLIAGLSIIVAAVVVLRVLQ